MGGDSSQRLKGTVHVFLPCLQAGRPGHLCPAVDPRVLPAGVEARQAQIGAATQEPRPTCTPQWPCALPHKLAEAAKQGAVRHPSGPSCPGGVGGPAFFSLLSPGGDA